MNHSSSAVRLVLPWLAGLLCGCSYLAEHGLPALKGAGSGQPPNGVSSLLVRYGQDIRRMDAAELQREFEAMSEDVERSEAALALIKLAMLESLPRAPFRNDERALQHLARSMATDETQPAGQVEFATLLSALIGEHLLERHAPGDSECGPERRRTDARVRHLEAELESSRARCADLESKLDALKRIEAQINEHPQLPVETPE
jgi:hypothetical protein